MHNPHAKRAEALVLLHAADVVLKELDHPALNVVMVIPAVDRNLHKAHAIPILEQIAVSSSKMNKDNEPRRVARKEKKQLKGRMGNFLMFLPNMAMARGLGVDRRVLVDAYRTEYGRTFLADSVAKPRRLATDLGLMTPLARRLWTACGIGGPETA